MNDKLKKKYCRLGHLMTPSNTLTRMNGQMVRLDCKKCVRLQSQKAANDYPRRKLADPKWYANKLKLNKNHYVKNPASWLMAFTKSRATCKKDEKQREFNLTHEWFQKRLDKNVCEVTGIPFVLKLGKTTYSRSPFQPSVDRIDRTKGYTIDNCQLVCLIYNTSKSVYLHEDLMKLARALILNENKDPLA